MIREFSLILALRSPWPARWTAEDDYPLRSRNGHASTTQIGPPVRTVMQARVRFAETDAAGIVHYAQYLRYLEAGRAEALRAAGLSSEMIATCLLQARLDDVVIRYRAPAHFDEVLEIHAWVLDVSGSAFRFAYEIHRPADQVLIATSETHHTWTEPTASANPRLADWLLSALDQLRG